MLHVIIALIGIALTALGITFALPSTHPSLIAKPGIDEVAKWTCAGCGIGIVGGEYCSACSGS